MEYGDYVVHRLRRGQMRGAGAHQSGRVRERVHRTALPSVTHVHYVTLDKLNPHPAQIGEEGSRQN